MPRSAALATGVDRLCVVGRSRSGLTEFVLVRATR